jgi:hypothetical protein
MDYDSEPPILIDYIAADFYYNSIVIPPFPRDGT